jgi:hypothetical protein
MIEILGADLDKAFEELNLYAQKMYQIQNKNWEYCEDYQVWRLADEDFDKLCSITEKDWKEDWGWWRSSKGSNLGSVNHRYNINNHYINAWDGGWRYDTPDWYKDRKYKSLLEYFCDEIGASTEKNVCAVAVDLAAQNNITMAELFKKYQG